MSIEDIKSGTVTDYGVLHGSSFKSASNNLFVSSLEEQYTPTSSV